MASFRQPIAKERHFVASDEEFEIMKTHTLLGAQTLEAAARKYPKAKYLKMARDRRVAPEKWNGTGYPRGRKGCDIPLPGRVVALADVYDALVSRRVYKGAFTHLTARSIILEGKENHFDPVIVEAFQAIESQFIDVQQRFSNTVAYAA